MLNIILQTEKKIRNQRGIISGNGLLQGINFGNIFECLLTNDPPMISLAESIFKLVLHTQDSCFTGIANILEYKNFVLVNLLLEFIQNPDTCGVAVSLFCECILRLHSPTSSKFIALLSENQSIFFSLITSSSRKSQHNGLKLLYAFLQNNYENLSKPLLLPALDILFTSSRCNVLHYLIGQIVKIIFSQNTSELPLYLLQSGHLTGRLLKAYQNKRENEHYGHIVNIAKWIMDSPYGAVDEMVLSSSWNSFYEEFVVEYIEKPGLSPPAMELRELACKSKTPLSPGEAI